jgi:cytochrome c2
MERGRGMKTKLATSAWILLIALLGCREAGPEGYRYAVEPVGRGGPADACVVCHSVEKNGPLRSAPPLWGIVDSDIARFEWYGYSQALAQADGTWTEAALDEYLADPDAFLPGTAKTLIGIPDEQERADVIAYLAGRNE